MSATPDPILKRYWFDANNGLYLCRECSYRTPQQMYVRQHMVSHSTARPHRCHYSGCGQTYKRKPELRRHINVTHLGLRPYVCTAIDCHKCFTQLQSLKDHIRSKHSTMRYRCSLDDCPKLFACFKNMVSHRRRRHKSASEAAINAPAVETMVLVDVCQQTDVKDMDKRLRVDPKYAGVGDCKPSMAPKKPSIDDKCLASEDRPKRQSLRSHAKCDKSPDFAFECNFDDCFYTTDDFNAIAHHFEQHWKSFLGV